MHARILSVAMTIMCVAASSLPSYAQAPFSPVSEKQEEQQRKQMKGIANQMLMHQLSMLKHAKSLQQQLEITEEQVNDLEPLLKSFQEAQRELGVKQMEISIEMQALMKEGDHEGVMELQSEMMDLASEAIEKPMEELSEVFLPHQLERIRQLGRQQGARMRAGNDDLRIPLALANELGLDHEQRRKLEKVTNEECEAYAAAAAELKKESREKIAESLTQEQRDKLHEIVGDLYNANAERMRSHRVRQKEARERQEKRRKEKESSDED